MLSENEGFKLDDGMVVQRIKLIHLMLQHLNLEQVEW